MTFSFRRLPFFPNFVRLFDRNLCFTGFSARRAYLKSIFLSMPCDSMRQKMFSCDFLRFVDISFHFVYISRRVTHSVQRVLVKISFHTSVLICKAETSVFVNKVPVLSCSTSGFSMWNIPRSILGGLSWALFLHSKHHAYSGWVRKARNYIYKAILLKMFTQS